MAAAALVGGAVFATAAIYYVIFRPVAFAPIPFDAGRWRASPSEFSLESTRLRMADDLIRSCQLHGRTRAQVTALLGPPEETGYFNDHDLVYHLGHERGFFGIDSEWLVLSLDDHELVSEARLTAD